MKKNYMKIIIIFICLLGLVFLSLSPIALPFWLSVVLNGLFSGILAMIGVLWLYTKMNWPLTFNGKPKKDSEKTKS